MPIAFDAASQSGVTVTDTSLTWAHTCTGDNRLLIVAVGLPTADTITGVTYAGAALTLIGSKQNGADRFVYLWYRIAPATGANDIVVTSSASQLLRGAASSYTGALQSGVPDASATTTGTSDNAAGTVTTVLDNCWVVMVINHNGGTVVAGADTILRNNLASDATSEGLLDSNAARVAGSNTINATGGSSAAWALVVASFAPIPAVGIFGYKSLLGVGQA